MQLCDSFHFALIFFALFSSINRNAAVTSVSKSTTQIIVPVYYSETADGEKKGNNLQPFTLPGLLLFV